MKNQLLHISSGTVMDIIVGIGNKLACRVTFSSNPIFWVGQVIVVSLNELEVNYTKIIL